MYSRNIKTGIGTINPKSGERKEKVFKDYRKLKSNPQGFYFLPPKSKYSKTLGFEGDE